MGYHFLVNLILDGTRPDRLVFHATEAASPGRHDEELSIDFESAAEEALGQAMDTIFVAALNFLEGHGATFGDSTNLDRVFVISGPGDETGITMTRYVGRAIALVYELEFLFAGQSDLDIDNPVFGSKALHKESIAEFAVNSNLCMTMSSLAWMFQEKGNSAAAVRTFSILLETLAGDEELYEDLHLELWDGLSTAHSDAGDFHAAEPYLEKLLAELPENPGILYALARCRLDAGRGEDAGTDLRQAIAIDESLVRTKADEDAAMSTLLEQL